MPSADRRFTLLTDGRLLVALGLLGVSGAAAWVHGSRGIVRRGRKKVAAAEGAEYTLRIWVKNGYDEGFSGEEAVQDLLAETDGVTLTEAPGMDDAGMWYGTFGVDGGDDQPEHLLAIKAVLENFLSTHEDVTDWSLEPGDCR